MHFKNNLIQDGVPFDKYATYLHASYPMRSERRENSIQITHIQLFDELILFMSIPTHIPNLQLLNFHIQLGSTLSIYLKSLPAPSQRLVKLCLGFNFPDKVRWRH